MSLLSQGIIISLKDGKGVIKCDKHGELPFDIRENFSDVEFTAEDINEEVEFTVVPVRCPHTRLGGKNCLINHALTKLPCFQQRPGNRAIRIKRVKEPLLLTICSAAAASASNEDDNVGKLQNSMKPEGGPNMKLDPELYEGVVTQTIIEPSVIRTSCLWM